MNKSLFDIIGCSIVFTIWILIAITAVREYIRLTKYPGISFFMTKKDLALITDPVLLKALAKWKRLIIRLFVIWIFTCFAYILIAAVIDKTIGFK